MAEPPTRIQAILWDVGGTLLDRISHTEALRTALLPIGVRPDRLNPRATKTAMQHYWDVEPTWQTLEEEALGFRSIAALMLAGTEWATQEQIERLGYRLAHYDDVYFLVPGIQNLLRALSDLHFRQAIVSNWPPSLTRILTHHRLDSFFCVVVGSGECGILKPDPSLFRQALDRLSIRPDEAVYIGNDPDLDIIPARALGMQVIHFDPRNRYRKADAHDVVALKKTLFSILSTPPNE